MFEPALLDDAQRLVVVMKARGLRLATAESCTGGLVAALITEIPGASEVLECGFVTYSNAAKVGMLGVDTALIRQYGAVSGEVARAMAVGAVKASAAEVGLAITGVAGPSGGTAEKPVGLVHLAVARPHVEALHRECRFGGIGRSGVRFASVTAAIGLLNEAIKI